MLGRRLFLTASATVGAGMAARPAWSARQDEWALFAQQYLDPQGRVVDTGNGNISHSEGQGYGMLFAVYANDLQAFRRIWEWTQTTLKRPDSALHAWKYVPNTATPVPDPSAATDGELLIALALSRAGELWGQRPFLQAAREIYDDVLKNLVGTVGGRRVLLPGQNGFVFADRTVINPSYYIFPSLQKAASVNPVWFDILQNGLRLLGMCRFGDWFLPSDWVELGANGAAPTPAKGWSPYFSYDAIRVPLHMWWGGVLEDRDEDVYSTFWNGFGAHIPAWVNLANNQRAPYDGPPGFRAVALCTGLSYDGSSLLDVLPSVRDSHDYYSAALSLLARVAAEDVGR
ncbi:endoglucanase [Acetobacter sp. TBRC 12305]|uniref:glycosyl hydrolase family 8 n=1 Tax=Acetobacter garciniae TaxID=2817435 RepID=UPI001C72F283|nr:glycosyl hydrolase family 8 [Acetobacter garciniae]MBX0345074.1 endoglucanase [Acetobacter garciniae]